MQTINNTRCSDEKSSIIPRCSHLALLASLGLGDLFDRSRVNLLDHVAPLLDVLLGDGHLRLIVLVLVIGKPRRQILVVVRIAIIGPVLELAPVRLCPKHRRERNLLRRQSAF